MSGVTFEGPLKGPMLRMAAIVLAARLGFDLDSVRSVLDGMTQGQSVMLATNEVMATCAIAFCAAALLIWLAPRSARLVDMSKVGH